MSKSGTVVSLIVVAYVCTGCSDRKQEQPDVITYRTLMGSIGAYDSETVAYANHVILVEKAPVDLKAYMILKGEKTLVGTLHIDPAVHAFAYATPAKKGDKVVIEIGVYGKGKSLSTRDCDYLQVELPKPLKFGSSPTSSGRRISSEEKILTYYSYLTADASLSSQDLSGPESMLEVSRTKPVSFVMITAAP